MKRFANSNTVNRPYLHDELPASRQPPLSQEAVDGLALLLGLLYLDEARDRVDADTVRHVSLLHLLRTARTSTQNTVRIKLVHKAMW